MSFPRFNQLPPEVRLLIWHESMPHPSRIVELKFPTRVCCYCTRVWSDKAVDDIETSRAPSFFDYDPCQRIKGPSQPTPIIDVNIGPELGFLPAPKSELPIPTLLLVCRESFSVASKYYTQTFGYYHEVPQTWFDFKQDILYLNHHIARDLRQRFWISPSDLAQVRNLAVFISWLEDPNIRSMISIFPHLDKLILIFAEEVEQLTRLREDFPDLMKDASTSSDSDFIISRRARLHSQAEKIGQISPSLLRQYGQLPKNIEAGIMICAEDISQPRWRRFPYQILSEQSKMSES